MLRFSMHLAIRGATFLVSMATKLTVNHSREMLNITIVLINFQVLQGIQIQG
jgi:hypothetical protein